MLVEMKNWMFSFKGAFATASGSQVVKILTLHFNLRAEILLSHSLLNLKEGNQKEEETAMKFILWFCWEVKVAS